MAKKSTDKDTALKPAVTNTATAKTETANKPVGTRAKVTHKSATRPVAAPAEPVPAPVTIPAHADIAQLAYALWQERGCVDGCAEQDWFRAEAMLRSR